MQTIEFANGVRMPQEGFGVFQIPDAETSRVVRDALDCGYRMIDTAAAYMNEEGVGRGIRESGVPRDDVFITTKVWVQDTFEGAAYEAVDRSLSKLGTDYIDLVLLHQPMNDYHGAWRDLEKALDEGKVRAIGVANFYPHVLTDLCLSVDVPPMLDQVEIHPFFQQTSAIDNMRSLGVVPQAWGSFAEGKFGLFSDPVLSGIGQKYGKTAAQVALRWSVQRGVCVIPKSVHRERMEQNLNIWDFELSEEDIRAIASLDMGHSEIVDHFDPAFVRMLHGMRVHRSRGITCSLSG